MFDLSKIFDLSKKFALPAPSLNRKTTVLKISAIFLNYATFESFFHGQNEYKLDASIHF